MLKKNLVNPNINLNLQKCKKLLILFYGSKTKYVVEPQKDFKIVEGTGQALLIIQSTLTNNERIYSISGGFMIKIRNRLNTEMLNALVFLKFHFKKD